MFLDGIRLNEPDAQEVDFDLIPSAALATSTLDRGSNVLFGRNSLGGTLLFGHELGEVGRRACMIGLVVAVLIFQIAVNVGMVVGLMPVTGIPLPLISSGGTSVFVTLASIGILLNITRKAE